MPGKQAFLTQMGAHYECMAILALARKAAVNAEIEALQRADCDISYEYQRDIEQLEDSFWCLLRLAQSELQEMMEGLL